MDKLINWVLNNKECVIGDVNKPYGCITVRPDYIVFTDNSDNDGCDYEDAEALEHIKSRSIATYTEVVKMQKKLQAIACIEYSWEQAHDSDISILIGHEIDTDEQAEWQLRTFEQLENWIMSL